MVNLLPSYAYQLRIVAAGVEHLTQVYHADDENRALTHARQIATGKTGTVELVNRGGERVLLRTVTVSAVTVIPVTAR